MQTQENLKVRKVIEKSSHYTLLQVSAFYNRSYSCISRAMKDLGISITKVKNSKTNQIQNGITYNDLITLLLKRDWGHPKLNDKKEITLTNVSKLLSKEFKESEDTDDFIKLSKRLQESGVQTFKRDAGQKAQDCILIEEVDLLRKIKLPEYPTA